MGKKLRPGRCYRDMKDRAYTRTARRVVKKQFIRGVPGKKLMHLDMGNSGRKYKYEVQCIAKENVQVRENALEASRIVVNRTLQNKIGRENYHFQIRVYPHHVMRENAIISGAGADRLQTGMKHSFGRPIGRAARVKRGRPILTAKVDTKKDALSAQKAIKRVISKLPGPCEIRIVTRSAA